MFRRYGIIGLVMILLGELNFYFKIEPFATYYYPIVWFGLLFFVDALVYMIKGNSYMMNRRKQLFWIFILSIIFWWTFEFLNLGVKSWNYNAAYGWSALNNPLFKSLCFSTVLPAVFEIYELIMNVHLFDKFKLRKSHKISKALIYGLIVFGLFSLVAPLIWPIYFFPLVWMSFFFLLDPINYLHKQPSLIKHLKDRQLKIPLSLMLAGLIAGFFWEFWNYWAISKWYYNIPFVGFFKIFEMPILGYGGYLPFALELYAMYYFVVYLYRKEVKILKIH